MRVVHVLSVWVSCSPACHVIVSVVDHKAVDNVCCTNSSSAVSTVDHTDNVNNVYYTNWSGSPHTSPPSLCVVLASHTRYFTLRTRKAPHLVVFACVVQMPCALNFSVRMRKAPHVKKHMVNMESNVDSEERIWRRRERDGVQRWMETSEEGLRTHHSFFIVTIKLVNLICNQLSHCSYFHIA